MSFDGKIEFITAKFDARPAPEYGERDNRMYSLRQRGAIADWLRDLAQPNIWDGLTDDQQNVLTKAPFNIHTDRASWKEKKKTDALEKRRNELRKFQKKYGVGVRPPTFNSTRMMLPREELCLGKTIGLDLVNYRKGNKDKQIPEMLALYRKFKLTEFDIDNKDDTTNHTILTAEEWCNRNTFRRSERGRDEYEPSDVSPTRTTTRSAAATTDTPRCRRRTRSVAKSTTAATSTDSGTSEPAAKRKKKAASCKWTDDEVKELESLMKKYGTKWSLFEGMNYVSGTTALQMRNKWGDIEKIRMKEMHKNEVELLGMLKKKRAKQKK